MRTPVAFFIFNRADCTARVWAQIRLAQPPVLLIVADGPRAENEQSICNATRTIVEHVDWPCDVRRNYSPVNMGCRNRVASGLDWVFQEVEEAIILEDDCLPHLTFFRFCEELLDRYRNDHRVMHIGGNNFQKGRKRGDGSYYFSKYSHIWGWATWRRAWKCYDVNMTSWTKSGGEIVEKWCRGKIEKHYWTVMFRGAAEGRLNTWDYAWLFACWKNMGLSIMPNVNLVSNIGFGVGSSNTVSLQSPLASLAVEAVTFPLIHFSSMAVNQIADDFIFKTVFVPDRTLADKIKKRLKRLFSGNVSE